MSTLFGLPLLLGLVSFLVGWLAAKFAAYVGARAAGLQAPKQDREIRALEANLRVAHKNAEGITEKLSAKTLELDTLRASLDGMEQTLQFRDTELGDMRQAVKDESKKVVDLRRTLTDRAEETIRANVNARDSETELSVLKAGASAMLDLVVPDEAEPATIESAGIEPPVSLAVERKELTNRLRALDEELAATSGTDESTRDDNADKYMSDC